MANAHGDFRLLAGVDDNLLREMRPGAGLPCTVAGHVVAVPHGVQRRFVSVHLGGYDVITTRPRRLGQVFQVTPNLLAGPHREYGWGLLVRLIGPQNFGQGVRVGCRVATPPAESSPCGQGVSRGLSLPLGMGLFRAVSSRSWGLKGLYKTT